MNFGQNLYNFGLSNMQPIVLLGLAIIGVYLIYKRKFTELVGFVVVALLAVGFVFNTAGVKDIFLNLFNMFFK